MADDFKPIAEAFNVEAFLRRVNRALAQASRQEASSPNGPRPWEEAPSFKCPRCEGRGVYDAGERRGARWYKRCRVPECVAFRKAQAQRAPGAASFIDQQEKSGRDEIL